jgi:SulP family sulfate permease
MESSRPSSRLFSRLPTAFTPKLVTVLREGYTRRHLLDDLLAGIIVGVVALPLAIAFGIASGVTPAQGLYTAIISGLLISLLGGSRVQIGGPTGAFVVIVYGIVSKYGYNGLATATLLAGLMLVAAGLLRLGVLVKYVPFPVTVGFTSGIASIIALGQVPSLLGLQLAKDPPEAIEKVMAYASTIRTTNLWALGTGLLALALVAGWPKFSSRFGAKVLGKIPGSLVAIIVTTALVQLVHLPVVTIGDRFGSVPSSLPHLQLPAVSLQLMRDMFQPAVTIALLAGLESLLSAVVADGMIGGRHRSNMELVAQGVANLGSAMFGGIPATGAIARTATNIKNGARSPIAGIIHALVLLLIMVFFGRWAVLIPMSTLAAILLVVAYNMSEWRAFLKLFRAPKSDLGVLLVTFFLTVLVDLTVALEVGVLMAAVLFIKRMSEVSQVGILHRELDEDKQGNDLPGEDELPPESTRTILRALPPGVFAFEVFGPVFFGAIDKFRSMMAELEQHPKVIILRMRHVLAIDSSGLHFLEEMILRCQREKVALLFSGIHMQPLVAMDKAGLLDLLGRDNLCGHLEDTLRRASELVGAPRDGLEVDAGRQTLDRVARISLHPED